VPLRVVILIVVAAVALTVGGMLLMLWGGYQLGLSAQLMSRQEELTEEAITLVNSVDEAVRCFLGDCPP